MADQPPQTASRTLHYIRARTRSTRCATSPVLTASVSSPPRVGAPQRGCTCWWSRARAAPHPPPQVVGAPVGRHRGCLAANRAPHHAATAAKLALRPYGASPATEREVEVFDLGHTGAPGGGGRPGAAGRRGYRATVSLVDPMEKRSPLRRSERLPPDHSQVVIGACAQCVFDNRLLRYDDLRHTLERACYRCSRQTDGELAHRQTVVSPPHPATQSSS